MRERNDNRKVARARFGRSGARLLAFAERSLETVDGVDDKVRRWLFRRRATSSSRDGVRILRVALPRDVQDAGLPALADELCEVCAGPIKLDINSTDADAVVGTERGSTSAFGKTGH